MTSVNMRSNSAPSRPTGAAFTAIVCGPNGSASKPLRSSSSAIWAKTTICQGFNSTRKRHKKPLSLHIFHGPVAQNFFKQHPLVCHMLIDDPKAILAHRQDERLAKLAKWLEGA